MQDLNKIIPSIEHFLAKSDMDKYTLIEFLETYLNYLENMRTKLPESELERLIEIENYIDNKKIELLAE